MRILLSNDDGYMAPGLQCLASGMEAFGDLTVVAPDRNRSGASNSLTLATPLRAQRALNGFFFVDGTPTDCVHIAITGLMPEEPDIVIAGINAGANLGDDVLYSGTVAAATEGRFLGLPAIAVSLTGTQDESGNWRQVHFETAAKVVQKILARMIKQPLPSDAILNVNVPDLPWNELQGFESTRLGHRQKSEAVVKDKDPYGRDIFWIGPSGPEDDAGPGTDFYAIRNGRVSISPLQVDLTRHSHLPKLGEWLKTLGE
jgi:5'-nucleotidase